MGRSNEAKRAKAGPHIRQARLSGPSLTLDPRTHAYRRDLADIALSNRIAAAAYAEPAPMRCTATRTMLRSAPKSSASADSELLYGEAFEVLELGSDWAWGYCSHDRYVGYIPTAALGEAAAPTHRVIAPTALSFSRPDVTLAHVAELPLGALVVVTGHDGRFHITDAGFIHERHLAPLPAAAGDWLDVALQFIGSPYLWGGRTRWGLDCSGLVQTALMACGIACPRDADMQRNQIGREVETPQRGDLVFFPGHVGVMADEANLLHANTHWMGVIIEPLADVVERVARNHERPILAIKRL